MHPTLVSKPSLSIEVVSDVVCPWCLIGVRRLEQAIAATPDLDVALTFRPFLLDPSTPRQGVDLRSHLRAKYGDPEPMFRRVEAAARESGIALDFSKIRRSVNTLSAHTLLRHAEAKGTQVALKHALLDGYFLEGVDVGSPEALVAIATHHGFTADEARALIDSEAERALTKSEAQAAVTQGVTGVPFFIFAGKYAVSGAQPVALFQQAIARARAA